MSAELDNDEKVFGSLLIQVIARRAEPVIRNLIEAEMRRRAEEVTAIKEQGLCVCAHCGSVLGEHKFSRPPRIAEIQQTVAHEFGITIAEMTGQGRERSLVRPRHIAIYLARKITGASGPMIARAFGDRDHSTIMAALRSVTEEIARDPHYAEMVNRIERRFTATAEAA